MGLIEPFPNWPEITPRIEWHRPPWPMYEDVREISFLIAGIRPYMTPGLQGDHGMRRDRERDK